MTLESDNDVLEPAVYEAAEKMLHHNFWKLVTSGRVSPSWVEGGRRFWYREERSEGHAFVLVDPGRRAITPAFDHEQVARALTDASGEKVGAADLPFTTIDITTEGVEFEAFDQWWRFVDSAAACEPIAPKHADDPMRVVSPNGRWAATLRDHDLWLIDLESGDERRLTADGVRDRAYAVQPDALANGVMMRRFGLPTMPPIVRWSPDSRRLVTHRTNQVDVELAHLVDAAPPGGGRPALHTYRYALPGDEHTATAELVVFDVMAGTTVHAKTDPLFMPLVYPILCDWLWWGTASDVVYYLEQPRDLRVLKLQRFDSETGTVVTVAEEFGSPRVEPGQVMGQQNVRVLAGGDEVLWWSQRDGWGHLYLKDMRTGMERQLTRGSFLVQRVLHVDENERVVYFVASGLVEGEPLRRQVCRVGLDGRGFRKLTDDQLDHHVVVPPGSGYFLDHASTRAVPPVISVRDWNGHVLVEVARADVTALDELGWTPPQSFTVTAADGTTDVHGILFLPLDFDPSRAYPVIDSPYPGPQHGRVNPAFGGYPHGDREAQAIAALGFVVVAMDGRGTPGRSRAFHDASFGRYDTAGFLEDHVVGLRQLAETRAWLDLERVGVYGDSGGGYATVRAMCQYPDVFKVGVSACGNHDQRFYHLAWGETFDGPYDEERYAASSNIEIADRLEGRLLLIHGGMDDNVHPHQTMRLVDRLIALDKDFDLLIVPGAEHLFIGYESYVSRRRWDFLVRHLLGAEPPPGFRLAPFPVDPSVFFG